MANLLEKIRKCNKQGMLTIFGGFLIHVTLGHYLTFGNMNTYLTSYIKQRVDNSFNYGRSMWIQTSCIIGRSIPTMIGGFLLQKIGPRWTLTIGSVLLSISVILTAWTINAGFEAVVISYGLLQGVGLGINYVPPLVMPLQWFPQKVGLAVSFVSCGFGVGPVIFNNVITSYLNPENVSPNKDGFFTDEELLDRVPTVMYILTGIYVCIQVIACILIKSHPDFKKKKSSPVNKLQDSSLRKSVSAISIEVSVSVNDCSNESNQNYDSGDCSSPVKTPNNREDTKTFYKTSDGLKIHNINNYFSPPLRSTLNNKDHENVVQRSENKESGQQENSDFSVHLTEESEKCNMKRSELSENLSIKTSFEKDNSAITALYHSETGTKLSRTLHEEEEPKQNNNDKLGERHDSNSVLGERHDSDSVSVSKEKNTLPPFRNNDYLTVREALKTREFYILASSMLIQIQINAYFASLFKAFGQLFINDDSFLGVISGFTGLMNAGGKFFWGFLFDKLGFKTVICVIIFSSSIIIGSFPASQYGGKPMWATWVLLQYFLSSGIWPTFPAVTSQAFGTKHSGAIYGLICGLPQSLNILGTVIITKLQDEFAWYGTCGYVSGLGFLSFILMLFFPRDPEAKKKLFLEEKRKKSEDKKAE
ncbi:uncharacterized protein LOC143246436 [Tachypleus tridentatus]|uniref:uncharacterized protein LOC143246436 n=1 Tax=Tachypleus tridentatus TaxID=6853 RepID=UPI003FD5F80D